MPETAPEKKDEILDENQEVAQTSTPLFPKIMEFVGELFHVVIISLAIIVPIRYFLIQPFYVKGASMEPSFYDHEYLIIDEISYRFAEPKRGDIVVFRYPNDPRQYFIKRIIAMPGERIKLSGGRVTVFTDAADKEGAVLDETSYLGTTYTSGEKEVEVDADQYFLMGDNRTASLDSRIFGPVSSAFIVGRVWFRGWPPEKIKVFKTTPETVP